ncbi:MAG: methionine adenosyltransferase [Bacteroidales bacterium]|jgi:S-adenosylmethionine synthetase|nr:methionine adenosyltransferase [Bacteroidales bacterium]MDD4001398.1 methionine adenosyltransferase [Bacteroidales bacterium]MDD4529863.1 methionine adenosyltransferase [Bacteroidales bacterium]
MAYFFTSESVSEGHPDKVSDQISDALLDEFLRQDPNSKVACETLVTTGLVVLSGEVKCNGYIDVQETARKVIRNIGYTKGEYMFEGNSCGVISTIHEQSGDINQGVERANPEEQGAGDQGMMFGYACSETEDYMPLSLILSHQLVFELAKIRREGKYMQYLRPDSKSQVTIEFDDNNKPISINTIVVSTQHDDFDEEKKMLAQIHKDVKEILIPRVIAIQQRQDVKDLFNNDYILHVNPTGKFVIGGPHGDTGLTGRKIIVDTYGGRGAHGGGAFSGKDSSKVDRSAAYAVRHIAKNMVAAGLCSEVLVQVAYAIGVAKPVGLYVNTYGTAKVKDENGEIMHDGLIAKNINEIFDLRPYAIIQRFGLKNPIFAETAKYGHFGRTPYNEMVKVFENGVEIEKEVGFYTWEKLDYVETIKKKFNL